MKSNFSWIFLIKTLCFKIFDRLSTDRAGVLTSFYPLLNAIRVEIVARMTQELSNYVCTFVGRNTNNALVFMTVDVWIESLSLQTICNQNDLLLAKLTGIMIQSGNVVNKARCQTQN